MRVLLFGTFDTLHPGHRFVLSEAAKRGDVWVVVARDANVQRIKGRAPVHQESIRAAAVRAAAPGATVLLGDPRDFLAPVREVRPDVILLGYDQRLPPGVREEDLPCPVERLPAFEPEKWKSSLLRKKAGRGGTAGKAGR
jgi:FAD synthetase